MEKKNQNTQIQDNKNDNPKKIENNSLFQSYFNFFIKHGFKHISQIKSSTAPNLDLRLFSNVRQDLLNFGNTNKIFIQKQLKSMYNEWTIKNINNEAKAHLQYINERYINGFDPKKEFENHVIYTQEEIIKKQIYMLYNNRFINHTMQYFQLDDNTIIDNIFDPQEKDETFAKQKKI
jgi:hypothetical protein